MRLVVPDQLIIVHAFSSFSHGCALVNEQFHIWPKRAPEKKYTAYINGVVFENVDVGTFGLTLQLVDEYREAVVIKLMVAEHVNDRNLEILSENPFKISA